MKTEFVNMGPARAKALLDANSKNRPISKYAVTRLADAIRRGEWIANGATIVVGHDGVLLDGQHRLSAIVAAGTSVPTLLVTGADPRAFMAIDVGGKGHRRGTDLLALNGEKHATHLQSAINWVERYYTNNVLSQTFTLTPQQTAMVLEAHPGIRDAVAAFRAGGVGKIVGASAIAAYYLFRQADPVKADLFMRDLIDGANLPDGDPVLVARNILINERAANGGGSGNAMRTFLTMVRAWNMRCEGRRASPHGLKVKLVGERRTRDTDIIGAPRVHGGV